jgi:two-component system sensor histidine kinase ChiS
MIFYSSNRALCLILCLTVCVQWLSSKSFGQPAGFKFDQIGLEQGLSQSTVNAIVQDAQGFMWFGTQEGLNRWDGYSMQVYKNDPTDSQSISDNTVWALLSDRNGDLWIGTELGGLNRYSHLENRFHANRIRGDDDSSLIENCAVSLFEDAGGNLWIGTRNHGACLFDRSTVGFHRVLHDRRDTKSGGADVWRICEDRDRRCWVGTRQGLYFTTTSRTNIKTEPYQWTRVEHDATRPHSLSSSDVRTVYCDRAGVVWVGTWGGGLNRLVSADADAGEMSFERFRHDAKDPASIPGDYVASVYEDSKGWLWIGTYDGGLAVYNRQTNAFERYLTESVLTVYEDRSGILWVGTVANGVKSFDRRKNRFIHYFDDPNNPNDLNGNNVFSILEDRDGELWIGTWGDGLNRYNRQRTSVTNYRHDPRNEGTIGSNRIFSLAESSDGSIWVAALGGGLSRFQKSSGRFVRYRHDSANPQSIHSDDVSMVYYDRSADVLWIGYVAGGVSSYHLTRKRFTHYLPDEQHPNGMARGVVSALYSSPRNGLWIGTSTAGLTRVRGQSIHRYDLATDATGGAADLRRGGDGLNNRTVLCIHEGPDGIIWIGTNGGGLNRLDPVTDLFTYYTTQDGLPNNTVYGILPDRSGKLWMSTNKGLSRFDPKTGQFRNYDRANGLQSNEFNWGAYLASSSGELFFGGVNGFNAFYPEQIEDNEYVPPVYLTVFKVFSEPIALPNPIPNDARIELSYAQNFISFEFVALNYTAPQENQYAYTLDGFDKDWHNVSAQQRYASYTNLDPGEYILRVKASNNDGIWNEEGTAVRIVVSPLFWMTWWFRALAGTSLVAIGFLLYRYRVRQLLSMERMRLQIATDLHDDIGTTLTGIALYSDLAKQELRSNAFKVTERLDRIAELSRSLLDQMSDIVWFIKPEDDSLQNVLLRMSDVAANLFHARGIEHRTTIHGEIGAVNLTMEQRRNLLLIYKEIINNILKHSQATRVQIDVRLNGDRSGSKGVSFSIIDNGCGFDMGQAKGGHGLTNIRSRSARIGAVVSIESSPGRGTRVELSAPLKSHG